MRPAWFPDWSGESVVIVASGPSAASVPLEMARGWARVIAVNESWRLAPWADMLFAGDWAWWRVNKGCPEFPGLKVSIDRRACAEWGLHHLRCTRSHDRLLLEPLGEVGWGGNSGFGAFNLAVQFGASTIILVGFDLRLDRGLHWHGEHPEGLKNPREANLLRWRKSFENAAMIVHRLGIQVINCSPVSALASYPKIPLADALESSCRAPAF